MRIRHKVRAPRNPKPAEVSPEYQAEVDRSTEKLQRRYERAKKAAEAARFRRDRVALIVGHNKIRAQRLADAEAALTARLAELADLERLMQENPGASLTHRGTEGWTKVPR
jgi:hypothetical protein